MAPTTLTNVFNRKLLLQLRSARGWSPQKAATEIGLSTQAYTNLELGRAAPKAGTLALIARVYGVQMDAFYAAKKS